MREYDLPEVKHHPAGNPVQCQITDKIGGTADCEQANQQRREPENRYRQQHCSDRTQEAFRQCTLASQAGNCVGTSRCVDDECAVKNLRKRPG